ncbi:MAG: hypothetical protein U5K56_05075 [Halioglobus sp.]|nr:hypothetical protein [Halioglobus sp.]
MELDYGQGNITVEMDDSDRDADGYKLIEGDRITVSGVVDDDFYESTKIEAASVYVEELGTHFYASSIDEEDTILDIDPHSCRKQRFRVRLAASMRPLKSLHSTAALPKLPSKSMGDVQPVG